MAQGEPRACGICRGRRDELKEARNQLQERKLVEKAKSILIQRLGLDEAEAYKRMRNMAMSKGKRMAEIAEAVILSDELGAK